MTEDITLGSGCVLEFDGGSINGLYTITFADTELQGNPVILSDYAGTILNKDINIAWFGTKENDNAFDNGVIIAKALNTFKRGYLYGDTYYVSTPIVIQDFFDANHKIELRCKLVYNGNNNSTFITFDRIYNCNITIEYITRDTNVSGCTGILIGSAKQNIIDTGYIHGFTNGVIIKPNNGNGNDSNIYNIREICANGDCTHLKIDIEDGWVNDNKFYNTYLGALSSTDNTNNIKGVHLKGYNGIRINTNIFYALSFEWCKKCIILEGAAQNIFNSCRTENCSNIITAIGTNYDNEVFITYVSNSSYPFESYIDDSQATSIFGKLYNLRVGINEPPIIKDNIKNKVLKVSDFNVSENIIFGRIPTYLFDDMSSKPIPSFNTIWRMTIEQNGISLPYGGYIVRVIDTTKVNRLRIARQFTNAEAKIRIRYIEKNGTPLTTNLGERIPFSVGSYSYDSSDDCFDATVSPSRISDIVIPDEITKVEIALGAFGILQYFEVFAVDGVATYYTEDISPDDSRLSVVNPPIGQQLYENGKPIWYNGTIWTYADGTSVT